MLELLQKIITKMLLFTPTFPHILLEETVIDFIKSYFANETLYLNQVVALNDLLQQPEIKKGIFGIYTDQAFPIGKNDFISLFVKSKISNNYKKLFAFEKIEIKDLPESKLPTSYADSILKLCSQKVNQNWQKLKKNDFEYLVTYITYLRNFLARKMDFTYKIPAEQLNNASEYHRIFRYLNFTKYYNHQEPLNQWFQNFAYELLTLTYDCVNNVSFSHEYLLEDNLNLLLISIQTLKMFYQYGMVIQIINPNFVIEEKGTHQNHVLEIIITKLKDLKDSDNLKIKNKKFFNNGICIFFKNVGKIFLHQIYYLKDKQNIEKSMRIRKKLLQSNINQSNQQIRFSKFHINFCNEYVKYALINISKQNVYPLVKKETKCIIDQIIQFFLMSTSNQNIRQKPGCKWKRTKSKLSFKRKDTFSLFAKGSYQFIQQAQYQKTIEKCLSQKLPRNLRNSNISEIAEIASKQILVGDDDDRDPFKIIIKNLKKEIVQLDNSHFSDLQIIKILNICNIICPILSFKDADSFFELLGMTIKRFPRITSILFLRQNLDMLLNLYQKYPVNCVEFFETIFQSQRNHQFIQQNPHFLYEWCNIFVELVLKTTDKQVNLEILNLMIKCCNILILGIDLKESRKCDSDLIVQTKVILPCITLILKDNIFIDFKDLLKSNIKKEEKEQIILFEVNLESKEMKKIDEEKPSLMQQQFIFITTFIRLLNKSCQQRILSSVQDEINQIKGFDAISIYKTLIGTKDKLEFSTELFKFLSNFKIQYSEQRKLINQKLKQRVITVSTAKMRSKHKNLFQKSTTMNSINFLNRVKDIFQEEMCARFQQYDKIERIAIKHKNLSMIKGLTGFLTHMTKENYIEQSSDSQKRSFLQNGLFPLIEQIICYYNLLNHWEFDHVIQNNNLSVIDLIEKNYSKFLHIMYYKASDKKSLKKELQVKREKAGLVQKISLKNFYVLLFIKKCKKKVLKGKQKSNKIIKQDQVQSAREAQKKSFNKSNILITEMLGKLRGKQFLDNKYKMVNYQNTEVKQLSSHIDKLLQEKIDTKDKAWLQNTNDNKKEEEVADDNLKVKKGQEERANNLHNVFKQNMDGLVIYLLSDLNEREKNRITGYSKKQTDINYDPKQFSNIILALNSIIKLEPNVSLKILCQHKSYLKILWTRLKMNLYHIVYNVNKLENQYIQVFELKSIINFMETLVDINIEGQSVIMLRDIFNCMLAGNQQQKSNHCWLNNMLELLEFVQFQIKKLVSQQQNEGFLYNLRYTEQISLYEWLSKLVIKVVDASTSLDQEIAIENYNWILLFHFLTFKNFLKQKGGHKGKQKFDANMLRVKLLILKTANKFVLTQEMNMKILKNLNQLVEFFKLKEQFILLLDHFQQKYSKNQELTYGHCNQIYSGSSFIFADDLLFQVTIEFYKFLSQVLFLTTNNDVMEPVDIFLNVKERNQQIKKGQKYVPEIIKFLGKISCSIEIVKEDGIVEEIFFIKPPKCMFLLDTTQQNIWKDIDCLNKQTKYIEFCDNIQVYEKEMDFYQSKYKNKYTSFRYINSISVGYKVQFLLTVIICIKIFFSLDNDNYIFKSSNQSDWYWIQALLYIKIFHCFYVLKFYFQNEYKNSINVIKTRYIFKQKKLNMEQDKKDEGSEYLNNIIIFLNATIFHHRVFSYIFILLTSLIGFITPLGISMQLLLVIGLSNDLYQLFKSFVIQWKMLSLMALMIVIIMFNLSLHMYINFTKLINPNLFMIYDDETEELVPNNPCERDFEQCFFNIGNLGTTIYSVYIYLHRNKTSIRNGSTSWNL